MIRNTLTNHFWSDEDGGGRRHGSFMTLGLFCLIVCMTFVAFSVDVGMISLTQTRMQNAVDAAALAAAMEITHAIENAGDDVENVVLYAQEQAAAKAVEVAGLNGVYIDPEVDVIFGRRFYNEQSEQFNIAWGESPSNVVKVVARKDNDDMTAPDARMQMLFAGVGGNHYATMRVVAVAYVESRDIVTVLDFSRSMNFDSFFTNEYLDPSAYRPQAEIEANMQTVWNDLGSPVYGNMSWTPDWVTVPSSDGKVVAKWRDDKIDLHHTQWSSTSGRKVELRFSNNAVQEFNLLNGTNEYKGTGSNAGRLVNRVRVRTSSGTSWQYTIEFYNNTDIKRGLGISNVSYPWGNNSNWDNFIQMVRDGSSGNSYFQAELDAKGYRRKFGMMMLMQYVLRFRSGGNETPVLWMTRHYPFHSVKEGEKMFCDFLESLNFSDHVGLVSYDTSHRVEQTLSGAGMPNVDISSSPLTDNYQAIRDIIEHKQAAHYSYATNMGGGLKDGKWLLDNFKRQGARPTILLMTDGNTNTIDSGETTSLPAGWNWDELFDYNGDGIRDYETSSTQFRYALRQAKLAVDAGITIHTLSVGADANTELMKAIAHLGGGNHIVVPGGMSVSEMQEEIEAAFQKIAAMVPPAKLLNPAE